jgi:hypothetical protein
MGKNTDHLARNFETENTGGLLTGFLAEEDEIDRSALWRLGSWGAAAVGVVIVALLASQSSIGWRREQVAAADLLRQSQQIQALARESQNETRRLASAIDTLNSDRDRLYSRVTVLEQGLDSVTGAITRQNSATAAASAQPAPAPSSTVETQPAPQSPSPAPAASPVATAPAASPVATTVAAIPEKPRTALPDQAPAAVSSPAQGTSNVPAATPATPLMASKSIMAPPDAAAGKLIEPDPVTPPKPQATASAPPKDDTERDESQAVQRTEFGVDLGGANSLNGLRALWRGLLKSKSTASLAALRPIVVVKESNTGLGMQLRLVAGPLSDAATAAKICAALAESQRSCETAVFDGQRLAMKADEPAASTKPAAAKPGVRRRRVTANEDAAKASQPSMLSSMFGGR